MLWFNAYHVGFKTPALNVFRNWDFLRKIITIRKKLKMRIFKSADNLLYFK